jgi:hypothetical protein
MPRETETMKIEPGLYRAGFRDPGDGSDPIAEVFVARGDVVCDSDRRGLARFAGVTKTRWYVYLERPYQQGDPNGYSGDALHVGELYADPERSNPGYKGKADAVAAATDLCTHNFDDRPDPDIEPEVESGGDA